MKDMILFPEDIDRLNAVLGALATKANLLMAILINKDGRLMTSQGELELVDTISFSALVAGNSASTMALAKIMGETEFCTMYHQGKDRNIYIAILDENTFLSVVFDGRTNVDRVKVFIRQFEKQLLESLQFVYDKSNGDIYLDLDISGDGFDQLQPDQNSQQQFGNFTPQQSNSAYYQNNVNGNSNPVDNAQMQANNEQVKVTDATQTESGDVFYIEPEHQESNPDTKYLYLQNKIKQSASKKKD